MNDGSRILLNWQNVQQGAHWSDLMKVQDVMRAHPGLVHELKRYSFESAVRLLGSLLTMPQCHANTIRLEALVHLGCVACSGKREADRKMVVRCAGRHLADSPLGPMEDPVEDVFIGNVATHVGNFRVFRGIQESGDFWLESALRQFGLARVPLSVQTIFKSVTALLALSELAVSRLGYA